MSSASDITSKNTLFSLKETTSGSLLINPFYREEADFKYIKDPCCYRRNENVAEVRVRICDHALPLRILMQIKKVSRATQSKWNDKETICQSAKPKKRDYPLQI